MQYSKQVIVRRWIPILKEYERTKARVNPRPFKFVKDLCEAHHISKKELGRYYRKILSKKSNRTVLHATLYYSFQYLLSQHLFCFLHF